jgi:hypothetical protein
MFNGSFQNINWTLLPKKIHTIYVQHTYKQKKKTCVLLCSNFISSRAKKIKKKTCEYKQYERCNNIVYNLKHSPKQENNFHAYKLKHTVPLFALLLRFSFLIQLRLLLSCSSAFFFLFVFRFRLLLSASPSLLFVFDFTPSPFQILISSPAFSFGIAFCFLSRFTFLRFCVMRAFSISSPNLDF